MKQRRTVCIVLACALAFGVLSCASVDSAPKYPNMVADADPFPVGTITAQFDRLLSSQLNTNDVAVSFHPRENAVVLEFRYELITYRQFWDQDDREQFSQALMRYKEDYAVRNLSTQYNRTRAAYGKVPGRIEWEAFSFSTTRVALPVIELGYRFRGDMPFFTMLQNSAREEGSITESSKAESNRINMYFTRAQADELDRLFDQAWLMELLENREFPRSADLPVLDSYREYGD